MMHTEEEAKTKCCCNSAHPQDNGMCNASGCMAWRWHNEESGNFGEMLIADQQFSTRLNHCLRHNMELTTLAEVCELTEATLLRGPNFGRKSLNELKVALNRYGLSLGTRNTPVVVTPTGYCGLAGKA